MKITVINGSPRKNGNTRLLLEKMIEKLPGNEIIDLNELNIKGCQACYSCKKNGNRCVINDDMQQIYKSILDSEMIILGSPTFMWHITAQTKLFTDRLYNFFNFNNPSSLKGKKIILLFTQGNADPNALFSYFDHFRKAYAFMGFDVAEMLIVPGVRTPGEVFDKEEIMRKISEVGDKLASGFYS